MGHDVWITGVGLVTSIGIGRDAFWTHALAGQSGAIKLSWPVLELGQCNTRIGAPVVGFDPVAHNIPAKDVNLLDACSQYALAASYEALIDAGFEIEMLDRKKGHHGVKGLDPRRFAVAIGSGIGGLTTLVDSLVPWHTTRQRIKCNRYGLPMLIPNAASAQVAIRYQALGEVRAVATACAAGTMSVGDAFRLIQSGEADVVLCGGTESLLNDPEIFGLMGFDLLKTMSRRNDDPTRASRPFDKERDGFVLSEGAGILVLERADFARARGAQAYAKVLAYASNCDAHSMMQIDPEGLAIERVVTDVMARAQLTPKDIQYINPHGTSTPLNDRVESQVFRRVFGVHADGLAVSSTKSMTGHAIAASGAIEVIATALTLKHGKIHPTINYEVPDPDCTLDYVPNQARAVAVEHALSTSYGFGGHNACIALGKV